MSEKQKARARRESTVFLALTAGILVLLNVLGLFLHARVDTTERELFSLSSGSKRLASSLSDRMEIIGYFSQDLPAPHNATERYVRDLLAEYRDASKGKISLRIVHPVKDEEKQAAENDNIARVQDQTFEADSFGVKEGFRGVAFKYLGDTRAIARVDSTDGLEYEITQIIKELTGEKVKIGVLTGHNEAPPQNPMQMMQQPPSGEQLESLKGYLPTYDVQSVTADKEIPSDLRALLIVQPDKPFSEQELQYINQYVMRGGSLAVFGGALKMDTTTGMPIGHPTDTGLNKMLEKWGVKLGDSVVADAQCGRARLPQYPIAVPYPPVPVVTFADYQRKHPVLFRLDQIGMPYVTPLVLNDALKSDKDVKRTVLANSTKAAWLMKGNTIDLKSRERWELPGYNGPYVFGVSLEGKLPSAFADAPASSPEAPAAAVVAAPARSEKPVHVLVFGTGYFMRDEFLPPPQEGQRIVPGGGVALALNAVDWLAQDTDLIAIRAKSVEDPTLKVPANVKEAEATIRQAIDEQDQGKAEQAFEERKAAMATWDQKKSNYRLANTLGLPILFALYGIVRWRARKARKANLKL